MSTGDTAMTPGPALDRREGDKPIVEPAGWRRRLAERVDWARDVPARTALKIANRPFVRRFLGTRHDAALAANRARLPRLAGIDAEVVAALHRDGVFVTSLAALRLPRSAEVLDAARSLTGDFAAEARRVLAGGKDFVIVPPERIVERPEIFAWGLHDRLLDIAEAYVGLPVAYDGVCINYTVADGREVSTRRWHRDWEDRKMLKIAVYLNDVDGQGGPFQMIKRADTSQNDAGGFDYALADDAALRSRFGERFIDDVVSCEGPAGTVIFTDTAKFFHRGKPATARDRGGLFYSYFARRPRHPFLCERTGMARRDIGALAEALGPRQQAAANWRRGLPPPLRLIPPAKL